MLLALGGQWLLFSGLKSPPEIASAFKATLTGSTQELQKRSEKADESGVTPAKVSMRSRYFRSFQTSSDQSIEERPARRLMEQRARVLGTDSLIMSKFPRCLPDSSRWVSSTDGKATMALTVTVRIVTLGSFRDSGFALMQFPGLLVCNCYCKSGVPLHKLGRFLSRLEASLRARLCLELSVVVKGDFKAKARPWGSSIDDPRGVVLELFAALLGLWPDQSQHSRRTTAPR